MRTAFRCVASRNRERGRGPRDEASQSPVGAQPSREESISFLSPAQAAGAPTFCDATESRQRSQPRGLRPLGHPPPVLPSLAKPSCGPTPAVLCKEKPSLRVPSGIEPRPGWRGLAHSAGVQLFNRAPDYESPTEKIRPVAHPLEAMQTPVGVPSGTPSKPQTSRRTTVMPAPPNSSCSSVAETTSGTVRK